MSQKTVSKIFLADYSAWNIFFTGKSVCFYSIDCLFDSGSEWWTHA